jgi:alpha-beta hydrolase superfamily lysophospholipase
LLLYLFQERLIFLPQTLAKNYQFRFNQAYEEIYVTVSDGIKLHGLLFTVERPRGLIFYLHGNAGSLAGWGEVASVYTTFGYDVFLLDYRGYGKSEGTINSESQLHQDVSTAYSEMLKRYDERNIIVLGYSLGSGLAAKLASTNNPKTLILQSPYYSLVDVAKDVMPFVPTFLLRYQLETHRYLKGCEVPIVLIHGDLDEVIPYSHSLKLKTIIKPSDTLITLKDQYHNGMTFSNDYQAAIQEIIGE